MGEELESDVELCEKAEPFLEKDDARGLMEAFENGSFEKHRWLLWPAIHTHAWNSLTAMWDLGIEEDFSELNYKDHPPIFDLVFAGQSALVCEWLDRGYWPEAISATEKRSCMPRQGWASQMC